MDAFHAQRHAAEALGIADRELPWLGTRVDPRGYKSFGKRLSRKIVCGDCGRPFGHKTWHSGTPNRGDVWGVPHELRQDRTHVGRLETYGGKLVENIVQAVARDLLVHAMTLVAQAGHKIVMHVHDEIVIDEPEDSGFTIADACQLMTTPPDWAAGLPLDADGYECDYYRKD